MKKFAFLQDWGTYSNQTFVVVGMAHEEILRAMKKRHFKPSAIASFAKNKRPKVDEDAAAFVWVLGGMSLLWFPEWLIDLSHYASLVHETNHLVFDISRDKGMGGEPEAQAYQQEYLWKHIVLKLNKFSGVKSKRNKRKHESQSGNSRRANGGLQGVQSRDSKQEEGQKRKNRKGERDPHTGYLYPKASRR